jgi:hypothetical protein
MLHAGNVNVYVLIPLAIVKSDGKLSEQADGGPLRQPKVPGAVVGATVVVVGATVVVVGATVVVVGATVVVVGATVVVVVGATVVAIGVGVGDWQGIVALPN